MRENPTDSVHPRFTVWCVYGDCGACQRSKALNDDVDDCDCPCHGNWQPATSTSRAQTINQQPFTRRRLIRLQRSKR
ncbi:MAG: hypothetical protein V7638_3913 [Acidobacteriota bacterium]|jgi:hypothetical protein